MIVEVTVGCNICSPTIVFFVAIYIYDYLLHGSFVLMSVILIETAPVVYSSEILATDREVPGSIPGTTRFSEK
jgi:hypothetical protein